MRAAHHLPVELVTRIEPRSVIVYAKAHGWEPAHARVSRTSKLSLFRRADQPDSYQQLIVPMEPSYDDFTRRMADAIIKLAEFEHRSADQTLSDLLQADADILRFSIRSQATRDGRLPFEQAVQALDGVKRSLLSAAHSVLVPQSHHPRLGRNEARNFLDQCSLGQTERGSYTVAVNCPISESSGYRSGLTDEPPFGRQTTALLMRSTSRLVDAIESDQVESVLDQDQDDPESTLSANLCDALLRIQPEENGASLVLSTAWSSLLPPPPDLAASRPVTIRAEYRRVIQDVYQALLPSVTDVHAELFVGYVYTMNGNPGNDGRMAGDIAVSILEEDLRAHLDLDADDYARALDAHARHAKVKFRGRFIRGARKHRIDHIRDFELLE